VRVEVAPTKNKTQGDALSAQGPIDRTPGRLVVLALICLYATFFFHVLGFSVNMGFLALSGLAMLACPLLIVVAILMRLTAPR
jgi:hypothetical protein